MKVYYSFIGWLFISCFLTSCSDIPEVERPIKSDFREKQVKKREIETKRLSSAKATEFFMHYGEENQENIVEINTSFGKIVVRLYQNTPLHRASFIYLCKNEYFNTTWFHRVSLDHVIQGGNSDGENTVKARNNIGRYRLKNEINPSNFHKRGVLAAARSYKNNESKVSNPFEFYITLGQVYSKAQLEVLEGKLKTSFSDLQIEHYVSKGGAPHLDSEHTVFGEVVEGMDVVEKINKVEVDSGEWPLMNVPITIKVIR